jgi:hypothetical protein
LEIISHTPQLNMRNAVALQGGTFNRIQGSFGVGGRLNRNGTLLWRRRATPASPSSAATCAATRAPRRSSVA